MPFVLHLSPPLPFSVELPISGCSVNLKCRFEGGWLISLHSSDSPCLILGSSKLGVFPALFHLASAFFWWSTLAVQQIATLPSFFAVAETGNT